MRIDCQTCPARQIACDGCMMQLLFEPVSSADEPSGGPDGPVVMVGTGPLDDHELRGAIDVFSAASMVNTQDAVSAKNAIAPRQGAAAARHLRILRAG
ncbi:hypothetical protein HH308_19260 [Gordonia sp. TBRC 11910]|uniref:Uncharacterized protein n=1 Tax=Gordonia asplenii TaxID=2725283 RepID=A0A848KXM2_9ACTN|nr:hypothetical protein [Gordonia asplenii]NMO03356.1 hypothetical protein [Gordonia asplenii]